MRKREGSAWRLLPALAGLLLVALLTLTPLCGLLYSCGCDWQGARYCNIHSSASPDCPWCRDPASMWGAVGAALALSGLTTWGVWARFSRSLLLLAAAAQVAWLFWISISALIVALLEGYPYFYGLPLFTP